MRILYSNEIDTLTATGMTALTAETLYPIANVQDQRLSTRWHSTAATDQTVIFDAGGTVSGGDGQPMFQATTNLLSNPEDWSSGWTGSNATRASSGSVLGFVGNLLTVGTGGSVGLLYQTETAAATSYSLIGIVKYSSYNAPAIGIYNASTGSYIATASVNFSAKTVTRSTGLSVISKWIDDYTVRVGVSAVDATPGNTLWAVAQGGNATGLTSIFSAFQLTATTYPLAYTATTRAAWATSGTVAYRLPPSGKFIVDCEFTPYFAYTTSTNHRAWEWYVDSSNRLFHYYDAGSDTIRMAWTQAGSTAIITGGSTFDGGTALTVNQTIRTVASVDISAAQTTGSRLIIVPRKQGSLTEATTWSMTTQALSATTVTSFYLGNEAGGSQLGGLMRRTRVYGGLLENTIATEQDIDDELKTKQLIFDEADYAKSFTVDAAAIMGHTISAGASVKVELNDYNEWNYTDGSGSSIIQRTMTWDESTILKFLDERAKRKYVRFSINDPNNDAGAIEVGRFWVGEHLDISPSSLLNFTVTKKRSDLVQYGRNRQKWADEGVGWRRFELSFPRTGTTMLDKVQLMYDTVGHHSSVIFCNFDTIRDYLLVEPVYCSIQDDPVFNHRRAMKFEWGLVLEEDR